MRVLFDRTQYAPRDKITGVVEVADVDELAEPRISLLLADDKTGEHLPGSCVDSVELVPDEEGVAAFELKFKRSTSAFQSRWADSAIWVVQAKADSESSVIVDLPVDERRVAKRRDVDHDRLAERRRKVEADYRLHRRFDRCAYAGLAGVFGYAFLTMALGFSSVLALLIPGVLIALCWVMLPLKRYRPIVDVLSSEVRLGGTVTANVQVSRDDLSAELRGVRGLKVEGRTADGSRSISYKTTVFFSESQPLVSGDNSVSLTLPIREPATSFHETLLIQWWLVVTPTAQRSRWFPKWLVAEKRVRLNVV